MESDDTIPNELDETDDEIDDEEILDPKKKRRRPCIVVVSVFIIQTCLTLIIHKVLLSRHVFLQQSGRDGKKKIVFLFRESSLH